MYGESEGELEEKFSLFLEICRENHLTLSPKKFQLCDPDGSIKFTGMILSSKGLSPDPDKMSVIQDFPIPVSEGDLCSWLGLCQQLGMWYPELASCQSGLRHLVRDDMEFVWTADMTAQMESMKQLLCGDVYVLPYDTMLVPTVYVDGSILNGAGFILVQQYGRFFSAEDYKTRDNVTETIVDDDMCLGPGGGEKSPTLVSNTDVKMSGEGQKGRMQLVKAGSCMSKPFWSQLSAIEIEFLSLYYAVMQCDFYL